jgi:hypothetical protein
MPLVNILSVQLRPDAIRRYEENIQRLAQAATKKKEQFHWTTHVVAFGEHPAIAFGSTAETFAALGSRGTVPELVERCLGAKEALSFMDEVGECVVAQRNTLSIDRPDLSYADAEFSPKTHPMAVVTEIRVRPGGREALEELLRKLAEAIPKVDDPTRIMTHQAAVGNLAEYWTVRPVREMRELDAQRGPDALLQGAFGASEGGLIFRNGVEAIEHIERSIVMYRPELSNPS